MSNNYLFVKYRTKNNHSEFGKIEGQVIEINLPRPGEENMGSEGENWLGFTRMPVDKNLWDRLMTGLNTIDVEKSTAQRIAISSNQDLFRIKASKYVSHSAEEWSKSSYFQQPASEKIYSDYVRTFLNEFTQLTQHIPTSQLINFYPHAWLFPSLTSIVVGRDGVAIVFDYPDRPDISCVTIDNTKILDNLLLPHPENKAYTSSGPTCLSKSICDDEHYVHIVGDGSFVLRSELGNPDFVIFEKRYHAFWENIGVFRGYGDGIFTKKHFKFVELFGDISESNFTKEKAKSRARLYAAKWVTNKISDGKIDSVTKLRSAIEEFKNLIIRADINEAEIERFIDQSPWVLERGFGYKRYHSQVTIEEKHLSRSEQDIRPDKFLERNDGYCDILDLKRPDSPILVKKTNRAHASAKLTEAEAQVDTYVTFVKEPKVRNELRKKGIKVLSSKGLVLMGRTPFNNLEGWEDIKNRLSISAFTYDDLIGELETLVSWIEEIVKKSKHVA